MPVANRIAKLRQRLAEEGLEALVVSDGLNRRYLSGFTGSAGHLILGQGAALFATDSRYYEQVGQQAPDYQVERVGYEFIENLTRMLGQVGGRRVGFEANSLTVATFSDWTEKTPDIEWVATRGLVEGLRAVKEPEEIETMREAVRLTDDAFAHVCGWIRPGMTEAQVAWEIEKFFRERGAVGWPAGHIVAAGPHGALPHARPTDRVIQRGEPIVIDMGCILNGYYSDMTRTVILGQADARFEEVYSLVLQAHQAAADIARADLSSQVVDNTGRAIIEAAGYGENFGHGLGHGVGLNIHEAPAARKTKGEPLVAGMTLTIEPGIYLPEWGGVRVEDLTVIEQDRAVPLTQSPKQLSDMVIPV